MNVSADAIRRRIAVWASFIAMAVTSTLLHGCAVPLLVGTVAGADLGVGYAVDERVGPISQYVQPTTEPSPVKGPLSCQDKEFSYGTRLYCVGGIPGHAKWCNDIIAIDPGSTSFIMRAAGKSEGEKLIAKHCVRGEVPLEIAELNAKNAPIAATGASKDAIRRVQQRLRALGYDPGPVDGVMGSKTRTAIREFQRSQGVTADGEITADLHARLNT